MASIKVPCLKSTVARVMFVSKNFDGEDTPVATTKFAPRRHSRQITVLLGLRPTTGVWSSSLSSRCVSRSAPSFLALSVQDIRLRRSYFRLETLLQSGMHADFVCVCQL